MTIFDDIDATSWIPGVLKRIYRQRTTSQRFLHDTQTRHGFHIMQSSQKHPRLEIGLRVASQSVRI